MVKEQLKIHSQEGAVCWHINDQDIRNIKIDEMVDSNFGRATHPIKEKLR